MSKIKSIISTTLALTILLIFFYNIYNVHASEIKTWVRGSAEIVNGSYEYIHEPGICGGVGVHHVSELTESAYSSSRIQYYDICSGYYDMDSTINFDSPPVEISAGSTVQLKASGSKTGDQGCCFIYDWFHYDGSCASLGSDQEVFLDLRTLPPDSTIYLPNGKETTGYSGTVTDDIDVALTMPENGTECTVTGHASDGLWLKWTYKLEVKEYYSDVTINSFWGDQNVVCSDAESKVYHFNLSNHGPTLDTGKVNIYLSNYPDLSPSTMIAETIPYSLSAYEDGSYTFNMHYPESMFSARFYMFATISSNNGENLEERRLSIDVACRQDRKGALSNIINLLLNDSNP